MLQPLTRPYPRGICFVTLGLLTGAPLLPAVCRVKANIIRICRDDHVFADLDAVVRESLVDLPGPLIEMKNLEMSAPARPDPGQGRRLLRQWYPEKTVALIAAYFVEASVI